MIREISDEEIVEIITWIKDKFGFLVTKHPFLKILIYEQEEKIGFLAYDLIYDRIEIEYIGTLPNYQNKHIATELLTYLFEKETSVLNTTLEVDTNNKIAINLYQKFGFKIVTIKKNYYSKSDAYYMMRK